jgi:hypothetical protein
LSGSAQQLPHFNAIQRSFGRHRIDRVQAFVGGSAGAASAALGARAYSSGDRVAFAEWPDLRAAAHEAAHVVQQHSTRGSHDGIGRRNDPHERHADRVAAAVASGRSSEALLGPHGRARSIRTPQVQFQEERDPNAERYEAADPGFTPRAYPQPTGAGVAAQGRSQLPTGTLEWAIAPRVGYVNATIEFIPNATVAAAKPTISYVQTVSSNMFNPGGESEVDVLPQDTDPYYGARWDPDKQTWTDEPNSGHRIDPQIDDANAPRQGSRPYTPATGSAVLRDSPHLNISEIKYFETAVVVIQTGEVLGSLRWNIQRWEAGFAPGWLNRWMGWEQPSSTIVRGVVCTRGASPEFDQVVARYYAQNPQAVRPSDGRAPQP